MYAAVCYRPFEADSNSSTVSCVSIFLPESNTLCIPQWNWGLLLRFHSCYAAKQVEMIIQYTVYYIFFQL